MPDVVLGLSGGVDSTASALLLQKAGYTVHALYLNNTGAPYDRAEAAAKALDIDFAVLDLRERFRALVIEPFIDAYLRGETPNPCVSCNRQVKFRALFDYADRIGAEYVATGHYAGLDGGLIRRGAGRNDQSYMLWQLEEAWLARLVFPLGDFADKAQVVALASAAIPALAVPRPSMDVCFIPEGDHASFIESQRGALPEGDFIDEAGHVLGRHRGIHRYTVGMRRHLGIAAGERMYVRKIDPEKNTVTLSPLPAPAPKVLELRACRWFSAAKPLLKEGATFSARVRHSRNIGTARLLSIEDERARILAFPDCGTPAPGQSAVLYDGAHLAGGGEIQTISEFS